MENIRKIGLIPVLVVIDILLLAVIIIVPKKTAAGSGRIYLNDFSMKDGYQYAVGRLEWPDGVSSFVAMVRP